MDSTSPDSHRHPSRLWLWLGVVVVVLVLSGGALYASTSRPRPATTSVSPAVSPAPSAPPLTGAKLGAFIPNNYTVTKESLVHLQSGSPPLTVVTDTDNQSNSSGGDTSDLLLFAWDGYVDRWTTVFNAAEASSPVNEEVGTNQSIAYTAILPTEASVTDLRYQTITPTAGRTDLVFWANETFGSNDQLVVGIVHYNGATATMTYSTSLNGGFIPSPNGSPVTGIAPFQTLHVSGYWATSANSMASPARTYSQVISWVPGKDGVPGEYSVTTDTRSWLGVYAITSPNAPPLDANTPLFVVSVAPGSPAAGVLQPGDEILSVENTAVPANAYLIGHAIREEIALQQPGTTVALSIIQDGQPTTVHVKLSSYAANAYIAEVPPTPGDIGASVVTDTPALASQYGLGTNTGALITQVSSNGATATAGLNPLDVITSVDGYQVDGATALLVADSIAGAFNSVPVTYVTPGGATATSSVSLNSFSQYSGPVVYAM